MKVQRAQQQCLSRSTTVERAVVATHQSSEKITSRSAHERGRAKKLNLRFPIATARRCQARAVAQQQGDLHSDYDGEKPEAE